MDLLRDVGDIAAHFVAGSCKPSVILSLLVFFDERIDPRPVIDPELSD
jgi:hypothetical protein